MKKWRRIISAVLLFCIMISLMPPIQITRAATTAPRYELDTDGIDVGATYLILNTNLNGSRNAMRFYYLSKNSSSPKTQAVTVKKDADGTYYIDTGFANEEECQFQFTGSTSGAITHGGYSFDLASAKFVTGISNTTMTFELDPYGADGAYCVYCTSGGRTYYLRYANNKWNRNNYAGNVFLYKLVEDTGCSVTYDGNGYTSGELPDNATEVEKDSEYTLLAPKSELRKDIGEDTWLFLGWNTEADGSGAEYRPGDVVKITEDLTLYADWYPQTKFAVSMITDLDGVRTDVEDISGQNKSFYVKMQEGDGSYIPLNRVEEGTYTAKVVENGDYVVYIRLEEGEYEPVHGHKVTIYNQDGATECQHFSVNYDTRGGVWAQGEDPGKQIYHALENAPVTEKVPTLAGNRFLYWMDQNGNLYNPGEQILSIGEKTTLTAQWEKTVSVRVNVVVDPVPETGGMDTTENTDVTFSVMRTDENGYNHLAETITLTEENCGNYIFSHDEQTHITRYTLPEGQVTLRDVQRGDYTVSVSKSQYSVEVESVTDEEGNVAITIKLKYEPVSFDMNFDVVVQDWENIPEELRPESVNIKVTYWGYNEEGGLEWRTITQQQGSNPPVTVVIDPATGKGHGFYPVWKAWAMDPDKPYFYRIRVSSYVMPDGSVHPAQEENETIYTAGVYSGTVCIVPAPGGNTASPNYPDGSVGATDLHGTQYNEKQDSVPTLNMTVTPFTVTFDAGEGAVEGKKNVVLENQFLYPDLNRYAAVSTSAGENFIGWFDENGRPAVNAAGQLLTGNVTYVAHYSRGITLRGDVQIDTTYIKDGQNISVKGEDLPKKVMVLVRKQVGELFVTVDSQLVPVTYNQNVGTGSYQFDNLINDGTVYQVHVLPVNFAAKYDNNLDGNYTAEEELVLTDDGTTAQLNIRLEVAPELYIQSVRVEASQIAENFRPEAALVKLLYRDLGDIKYYDTIPSHTPTQDDPDPECINVQINHLGEGTGSEEVWARHTNGAYYEYQMEVSKLYGSVEGGYLPEGTEYTVDSPYTVVYGPPSSQLKQTEGEDAALVATLVPKQFLVVLDLNMDDPNTPVLGMEKYINDDGEGNLRYAYTHTWSYGASFEAYPYREGYVFLGWEESESEQGDNNLVLSEEGDGKVYVGATLDKTVVLKAKWKELKGTDYTVRHLEMNTDKVLAGAQTVSGTDIGTRVVAAEAAQAIQGYEYAGALVGDTYFHKSSNPEMIVSDDPMENLMVIYYLPDASSGFTEQVENNLEISKTAVLEDNGTYTITMDSFAKDNPITTMIRQDTPMDVVLVLDQSGSMYNTATMDGPVMDLKEAVSNFVGLMADHGREHEVAHRIAIVGYASDRASGYTSNRHLTAGSDNGYYWYNTGVFDSHGDFHTYSHTGFNYTEYTGSIMPDGVYYTYTHGEYLLMTYHQEYRHLITEAQAREEVLNGAKVYGYVDHQFVELTRNSSGLWLYGDKKLYSDNDFFTYHTDVWTHRHGLEAREIHAFGTGDNYQSTDGHSGVYVRTETQEADPDLSIYRDALVPVTVGANGSGSVTPGLEKAAQKLGANGETFVSYGMEMANSIFEANPLEDGDDRVRIIIVFTDGKPGDGTFFDQAEAERALEQSAIAYSTYKASVYTVGMYGNDIVSVESDQNYFMSGLSSNYPNAKTLNDIWLGVTYKETTDELDYTPERNGPYYVQVDGAYYELVRWGSYSQGTYYIDWGYTNASGQKVVISETVSQPVVQGGMLNGYKVYRRSGSGYKPAENSGYYTVAKDTEELKSYFANMVTQITTNITTEIVLYEDTILRDIMNQGFVLTPNSVVTAYREKGELKDGKIVWTGELEFVADVTVPENASGPVGSEQKTDITSVLEDGTEVVTKNVPYIQIYNLDADNATNANEEDYHPHTVDVTGYDFKSWYIGEDNPVGYKMVVTITGVEATDDVRWGRSTATNAQQSGLWLPKDGEGNRQLLLAFDQPSTIFVERAFVLDYAKQFTLANWYFDDESGKDATPVHLDCDITNGMNKFDPAAPNTTNAIDGKYGNTQFGNVKIENGQVVYTPTSMNWAGYDEFYVFGDTWRKTVLDQDANQNGNLWNKVTVIPANNIYYEDSFITTDNGAQNGVDGFVFTGAWSTVGKESGNVEIPEHLESAPYGDVHGWTDALGDDKTYTDGSAHMAFEEKYDMELGASVEFTFTGTGVEVYSRTNKDSGMVVAILKKHTVGQDGKVTITTEKSMVTDNLTMSGDYYAVPCVSFEDITYGTYTLQLIATASSTAATGVKRYQFYLDGVRVHNPLGYTTNYMNDRVKDAYGLETNAVVTEVRDILLDNGSFDADQANYGGAVFIDWLQDGQGNGEEPGKGVPTYDIGTFEVFGPKNEVYLKAGQAIVIKVAEGNNYYVGLKSLTGKDVVANLSGVDKTKAPTAITITHTTDMYYRVHPVDGYIVIQNGNTDDALLSITNLQTTNATAPAVNGGVLKVEKQEAVMMMRAFSRRMVEQETAEPEETPEEEIKTPAQPQTEATIAFANTLFPTVSQWLNTN